MERANHIVRLQLLLKTETKHSFKHLTIYPTLNSKVNEIVHALIWLLVRGHQVFIRAG